jgi:CBS domain-containing protein
MRRIGEIVHGRQLLLVQDDITVHEAARFMSEKKVGAVPVLSGDRLVGVFSERDLMTRVVVPGLDPRATSVRDVMTRDLVVAAPDDTPEACEVKMAARGCRHLPVVESGRLLGFLSLRDLLRCDLEEKTEELAMMNHYVQYIPPDIEQRLHGPGR